MSPDKPTRRELLWQIGGGGAGIGLSLLLAGEQAKAAEARPPGPHFPPKARHIIMVFLPGGISAVDTFDYKPELEKHHGKETQGANTITPFFGKRGTVMRSPWKFRQHGESGLWVSDVLPHLAACADDLTLFHSMVSRSNAHGPAIFQMSTGFIFQGFPSIGSWISYGLGSENGNLPSFVVLPDRRGLPPCGVANWGNGFLPAAHQGVIFGDQKEPISDLNPPSSVSGRQQAASYDLLTSLNENYLRENPGEDSLAARIKAYELAAKMQLSAPEATDITAEPQPIRDLYGLDEPATREFGYNCLLARRLVERGVRCIQMYNGGHFGAPRVNWDAHEDIRANHGNNARILDKPLAALIKDLKQRGLLDETLLIFTTEFGRLPISEGLGEGGRDHNPEGFTSFMAGPGLKHGISYGSTDELGYKAVENPVTIYDFHATALHLLGLDHKDLNWYHNGIRRRLTDVHGRVLNEVLA
jgi:hypothetical protein